jgi:polyhydroxyalkanoate synthesis repressor PhaR
MGIPFGPGASHVQPGQQRRRKPIVSSAAGVTVGSHCIIPRASVIVRGRCAGKEGQENPMAEPAKQREGVDQPLPPVVIKKYANRRLYNTEASSYVTLEDLAGMVRDGRDFVVYDAKTGDDITRGVLTQIIVEEESKGRNLLPIPFLRQLIGLYGDSLQTLVPRYLEYAMGSFSRQQEQMRQSTEQAVGGFNPFGGLEEVTKKNMAMMERAMTLFSPFPRKDNSPGPTLSREAEELEMLKAELQATRQQLAKLRRENSGRADS